MQHRAILLTVATLAFAAIAAAAPPHTDNPATPRDGAQTLALEQVFNRGHEDDDLFFGAITTVQVGPDGAYYVLDQQLSQVPVLGAGGELLRVLSREGEGPGETRQPEDMVFLPDGSLGLAQYINGRIITLALDGTPGRVIMPPGHVPGTGGLSSIRRVRYRGGSLVINGAEVAPATDGQTMVRTQYLKRCDEDGRPLVTYLERSTSQDLMRDGWIEKNNWFPSHERWDIDADGMVLAASDRNEYRVDVLAPDGTPVRSFGRAFRPWPRTEAEKQEIRDSLVVLSDGQRITIDVQVEDAAPAIASVRAMADGETWVLPVRGTREQPDGVMQTYDVFDRDGVFVRQVAMACPGDPEEDRLVLLPGRRAALLRGAVQARRNTFGGNRQADANEVSVNDLVVYRW